MSGPLEGLKVIEMGAIGPTPHACMVLADLGADVIRVERAGAERDRSALLDPMLRGRRIIGLDLKDAGERDWLLKLVAHADVLVEGFRPGVMERLGLGPSVCRDLNPGLVYARMTGWGQDGPLATSAGHDINYIALSGALHAIGAADQKPPPPLNLVGDFGGGSMLVLTGILAALVERTRSGEGQTIDAAMVDGVTLLSQGIWSLRHSGQWGEERGANLLDSGAPFYDTYVCACGGYVAVGAIEPQFFALLVEKLGLDESWTAVQMDTSRWGELRATLAAAFLTRSRDEWGAAFALTDACVTPVLSYSEAPSHPHIASRETIWNTNGVPQAASAPRFSRTPADRANRAQAEITSASTLAKEWASI
ncbi:CaiB/BaiF CoA transferase family protein [Streptomyces sp. NPDC060209]|uniref:CaiB/BaiF CoA transferase family protein n=1 Tax=Streptomyces sp. NPDC060209 TaxID=3347073 RepID=UPI0036541E56